MVNTKVLVKTAVCGALVVSATGYYLQNRIVSRVRDCEYYKKAFKILRSHRGAVYYLGEPIKDKRFDLSDEENNFSNVERAGFSIPVSGPKEKGTYYFWAEHKDNVWSITKAELELKSKPDKRLIIVKEN